MKNSFGRAALATMATIGALAMPVPAASQETDPLVECHRNCYQAYVVNSNQPTTYAQCRNWCIQQYDNASVPDAPALDAVRPD